MSPVVEKIKKLLSLANSSNEHEASVAAQKAQELLIKFNLSMDDVAKVQEDNDYVREDVGTTVKRRSKETFFVNKIVQKFYFVEIVTVFNYKSAYHIYTIKGRRADKQEVYIGRKSNIEIAKYVSEFLHRSFRELWAEYKAQTGADTKAKDSFYLGLYKGLNEKMQTNEKKVSQEMGLVIVPDAGLELFKKNQFRNLTNDQGKRMNQTDHAALAAGHEQGKNMNISMGIGGPATKSGKLLK